MASYQLYQKQVEILRNKFRTWAESGKLSPWYGFDLNDVSIYHDRENTAFTASWRGKRVGLLIVDVHHDQPPDERHVFKVAVEQALQRKGIAKKLYDAADAYLATQGQHLVPSKVQHPDGAAFWRDGAHPRSSPR